MAWASYLEPTYSKKLNRYTKGEPISRERYLWVIENLPKLANNHNEGLTDAQIGYFLAIQAVFPGKADKASQEPPTQATEHLTHTGIAQGSYQAVPRGDR